MDGNLVQYIFVAGVLAAAVLYLLRFFYRQFVLGKGDCHCDDGECGKKD